MKSSKGVGGPLLIEGADDIVAAIVNGYPGLSSGSRCLLEGISQRALDEVRQAVSMDESDQVARARGASAVIALIARLGPLCRLFSSLEDGLQRYVLASDAQARQVFDHVISRAILDFDVPEASANAVRPIQKRL